MADVLLVEHQSAWAAQYAQIAAELSGLMQDATVEHIGSTSVAGLCAKPVIDVLLGAPTLDVITGQIAALAAVGYRYRPEYECDLPQRRYFVRAATPTLPRVHLHGVLRGAILWRKHLAFRDALRRDAKLLDQYARLKRQLAARHADDKAAYTEAKGPFIAAVLANLSDGC